MLYDTSNVYPPLISLSNVKMEVHKGAKLRKGDIYEHHVKA